MTAMGEVERLLTVGMVRDPADPQAQHCLREHVLELDRRFEGGFDPKRSISADAPELRPPAGLLLVASLASEPVGWSAGYREVAPFNDEPYAHHWFEKNVPEAL